MKYTVGFKVDARYFMDIEAENVEEALEIAQCEITDVDFGEAEDIDCDPVWVDDEDGNEVWEA